MSILITGIGGMVGQGVLKNIRQSYDDRFRLIGIDINQLSAGHHLCDDAYQVASAERDEYLIQIKNICRQEDIELIIPTTDAEMYYISKLRTELNCKVACSPIEIAIMGWDKGMNYIWFNRYDIPFAETRLPSEYTGEFASIVVKPRRGRGSREIIYNPVALHIFPDDRYIVQEYLPGDELTIAFYVLLTGELHGFIVFRRDLKDGYTNRAEVVTEYNEEVEQLINKMIHYYPFQGSINIQAKVTDKGIIPFELNCRLSGTNSVRSHFGFRDVEYTVDEYLLGKIPRPVKIIPGTALRMVTDVIYPGVQLNEINNESKAFTT